MTLTVAPTFTDVYTAVSAFIQGVLPLAQSNVVRGNQNRNASPVGPFAVMNIVSMKRLRTNIDSYDPNDPAPEGITREQGVQCECQIDVYGPLAGDWTAMLTTLWRDQYGCDALAPNCQPLHADDPTRVPVVQGEEQYIDRWMIRATLQYNPVVSTVQDFANTADVGLVSVDVVYPPLP